MQPAVVPEFPKMKSAPLTVMSSQSLRISSRRFRLRMSSSGFKPPPSITSMAGKAGLRFSPARRTLMPIMLRAPRRFWVMFVRSMSYRTSCRFERNVEVTIVSTTRPIEDATRNSAIVNPLSEFCEYCRNVIHRFPEIRHRKGNMARLGGAELVIEAVMRRDGEAFPSDRDRFRIIRSARGEIFRRFHAQFVEFD